MNPREIDADMLRLHYGEHWPVGTIARQLALHPDVVRRVLGKKGIATPGKLPYGREGGGGPAEVRRCG